MSWEAKNNCFPFFMTYILLNTEENEKKYYKQT